MEEFFSDGPGGEKKPRGGAGKALEEGRSLYVWEERRFITGEASHSEGSASAGGVLRNLVGFAPVSGFLVPPMRHQ